jgi:hypothetical protein
MATKIYDSATIRLIDGTEIYITPLKIKYLRDFLDEFENIKTAKNDDESMSVLSNCATIAMKQYYPSIKTVEQLEDLCDLKTVYKIVDVAAGIKIDRDKEEEPVKQQAEESGSSWDKLDLAKLETEVFLLGIWKDFSDLESSISIPELTSILELKRELDYDEKKFLAAIQGVDLDEASGKENEWEAMKARVFSGGKATSANDIVGYQGSRAAQVGFGIGMGLDYEDMS